MPPAPRGPRSSPAPCPPDPASAAAGSSAGERRPRGGPGPGPAPLGSRGTQDPARVARGGDGLLVCRQSVLVPSPTRRARGAGPRGRAVHSPASARPGGARGPRAAAGAPFRGRRPRARRGPEVQRPGAPRAAAFVSPRGCADHEARAPGWGRGPAAWFRPRSVTARSRGRRGLSSRLWSV